MGLTFTTKRRRRLLRLRTAIALLIVIGVGVGAGALFVKQVKPKGPPALPKDQIDEFLRAWTDGDTKAMSAQFDKQPPATFATLATALVKSTPGSRATYTRTSLVRDPKHDTVATAGYHARVDIAGFGPVEWDGTLPLVHVETAKDAFWRIRWQPSDLYPDLKPGQRLVFDHTWEPRAAILASDGSFLAGSQAVVKIGLEPDRIKNLPHIKQVMHDLVGTDAASIDAALHGPGVRPNYFVEIAQVPDDARYRDVLRPQLYPIHGVFFQHTTGVLAPAGLLGAQLLGSVGEITAERLKELGPPYRVGDQVGLGGLQEVFEERLAGRPTGTVDIEAGSKVVSTVKRFPGRTPEPVQITIDPRIQQAADAALAGETSNAALVALDTVTGRIRAVVSKPDNGFARALDGSYPPGSTFKVITSAALLAAGRNGSTPAPCPARVTIEGKEFTNFEGEASGALDLARAFQVSCNNAFIGLADKLPSDALGHAAEQFGFNVRWKLPLPSYGGSYPTPKDRAELAASAIGQGRVLASPAQMASVAAAVASGQWHAPSLTTQPAPDAHDAPALDPGVVATLREFMASVVQGNGTAAGAGLPAGVFGKTGTAEFGDANPPETHAWFIGYQGTLAFAVIVEGGGVGGRVAAPIAARFLDALAAG